MAEFLMPILGADMQEGTVIAWRKQPGDSIGRGDIVAEVETDKANVEVESWMEGVLERILVGADQTVAVGTPIAIIRQAGEEAMAQPPAPAPPPPAAAPPPPAPPSAPDARLRISPTARALATEAGIDATRLRGTGPDGRIMRRDVERAIAAAPPAGARPEVGAPPPAITAAQPAVVRPEVGAPLAAAAVTEGRPERMRRAIAAAMERSAREIPQYGLRVTVDMSYALDWLEAHNSQRPYRDRVLPVALFIKATATAAREVPEMNATWADGRVVLKEDVHAGVAIFLHGGGLVAPAIHHADRMGLDEVMAALGDVARRARAGSLRSSELLDPTITVTSVGDQGAEEVWGLVNPPQAAIVGFGAIGERPWAVKGGVVARPVVTVTLSADHRVSDGRLGSRFLAEIAELLQRPEQL